MRALAKVARGLGPQGLGPAPAARARRGDHRRAGQGEHPADTLEALLGAIYLQYSDIDVVSKVMIPQAVRPADGGGGQARARLD